MSDSLKVAGIATRWIRSGDYKEANFNRVSRLIRMAAAEGAQIACTTEGFLDGYHDEVSDQVYRDVAPWLEDAERSDYGERLKALARESGIYIAAGVAVADRSRRDANGEPKPFNACQLYSPEGELLGAYYKTHNYRKRSPWFKAIPDVEKASCFPVFETRFGRVGFMICNDRIFAETTGWLADNGAQWILCPTGGAYAYDMLRERSGETGVGMAWVHPYGFAATAPSGELIAEREFEAGALDLKEGELGGPLDHQEVCHVDLPGASENTQKGR